LLLYIGIDTYKVTAHRQGQHAEAQGRYTRANSSKVETTNECQLRHSSQTGWNLGTRRPSTHLTDWINILMLGFKDKVKRVKLSTHLTDWMNMLRLRDEVNEQTAVRIYTVVTRNKYQFRHTS